MSHFVTKKEDITYEGIKGEGWMGHGFKLHRVRIDSKSDMTDVLASVSDAGSS